MRYLSNFLRRLAVSNVPTRARRRGRVEFRPAGLALENKTLQSQFQFGAQTLGPSLPGSERTLVANADVHKMTAVDVTNPTGGFTSAAGPGAVRLIAHSQNGGKSGSTTAASAMPEDSGKIDPKDPGGVELVRPDDSGKIDPKDPGGVELDWRIPSASTI